MSENSPNYSMSVYLEMCDKMIESIVSHLEYREFEKNMNLQESDKWKKNAMKNYCEQLHKYIREQLRARFERVAAANGLNEFLRARFAEQQRVAVVESLDALSAQMRGISLSAYYELLNAAAKRIVAAAEMHNLKE